MTKAALKTPYSRADHNSAQMIKHAKHSSVVLRAIANHQRLLILCHLNKAELTVSDLHARLKLSQSALSQHLAILRQAKIVETRREAHYIHYRLGHGLVRALLRTIHHQLNSAK